MATEIVNVDQARAWEGEEEHWVEHEAHYDAGVRRHGQRLYAAARIGADEHVLDVGCGCGQVTRDAAPAAPAGSALGVDLSARMIARARERAQAEGLANARFEHGDAQVYPFEAGAYDLALSRFGAVFFGDPVAAFGNVARALRPGGRLGLLAWQALDHNEWLLAVRGALAAGRTLPQPPANAPSPFGLADPVRAQSILTDAGFVGVDVEAVEEPIWLGADGADAFGFLRTMGVTRGLLNDLDEATAARALDTLRETLAVHATGEGVLFGSAAWLITARRS